MKVYLDTNVVIQGGNRAEHERIKEMSVGGEVDLYWSPSGQVEQRARSMKAHERVQEELRRRGSPTTPEEFTRARQLIDEGERLRAEESEEIRWWPPARLNYPNCTFEGLLVLAMFYDASSFDFKGELGALGQLNSVHGIQGEDATHLMIAHSAEMDYFLSWDGDLIKRAQRVPWLRCQVCTPGHFINSIASS